MLGCCVYLQSHNRSNRSNRSSAAADSEDQESSLNASNEPSFNDEQESEIPDAGNKHRVLLHKQYD